MSRPWSDMKKPYCPHGFPPLRCITCARQAPCMHGMLRNCLLCPTQSSRSLLDIVRAAAMGAPAGKIPFPVTHTPHRKILVKTYVDKDGHIQNADFSHKPIAALEKGPLTGPKAIVLHRTDSSTAASSMQAFERGVGTHFIVDKDGTVTQTASLLKRTSHVGKIKSRCYETGTCPADEKNKIKSWGFAPTKVHNHEKAKDYPTRYPMNEDSVGIEVVAKHLGGTWEDPTSEQLASVSRIVKILKDTYGIGEDDIYEHDKISYKTLGEGAGLYGGSGG